MESTGVPGKVQISRSARNLYCALLIDAPYRYTAWIKKQGQSTRTWLDEGGHDYDFEQRIVPWLSMGRSGGVGH